MYDHNIEVGSHAPTSNCRDVPRATSASQVDQVSRTTPASMNHPGVQLTSVDKPLKHILTRTIRIHLARRPTWQVVLSVFATWMRKGAQRDEYFTNDRNKRASER